MGRDRQIKTIARLKELASRKEGVDCHLKLQFGIVSRKHITYDNDDGFYVHNLVDGSDQVLSEQEVMDEKCTNIGAWMKGGALFEDE